MPAALVEQKPRLFPVEAHEGHPEEDMEIPCPRCTCMVDFHSGYEGDGIVYCCEGCAQGIGCTCGCPPDVKWNPRR